MLYLVTGTPGAKKTAFVVTTLDKVESQNKANIVLNKKNFIQNKAIIEKENLQHEFSYLNYEVGSGHTLQRKVKAFDSDYFSIFEEDFDELRPDDYFKRSIEYNEILERIVNNYGIKGFLSLAPVRTIYTNINNLKIDFVRSNLYDWRDCPDGSIIVIDEVQLVEPYDDVKDKNNEIVQSLTIHRHRGFDFYFITQAPMLLHPTVKALIGVHYHLTVPFGWRTRVYQYGSTRDNPNALINKTNCERKFDFSPPDRIFKLYKSTTINTHQKRLPWKMLVCLFLFILLCIYIIYSQINTVKSSSLFADQQQQAQATTATEAQNESTAITTDDTKPSDTPSSEEASTQDNTQILENRRLYLYSQNLPPDYEIRRQDPALQIRAVISKGDKCLAYNAYGDTMTLTHEECKSYVGTGRVYKATNISASSSQPYDNPAPPPIDAKPEVIASSSSDGEKMAVLQQ